jgi:regulator of protease activity HflC (stomatin/prohibitin superfamily)
MTQQSQMSEEVDRIMIGEVMSQAIRQGAMPQHRQQLVVASVVGLVLAVILIVIADSHHTVQEGSVGIYFKFGALDETVTQAGVHWKAPFVTDVEEIRVQYQTDTLEMMQAVTKDGIENTFNDVQVISRIQVKNLIPMVRSFGINFREALVFDRVKEELRKFCANHTIDEVYNTKWAETECLHFFKVSFQVP